MFILNKKIQKSLNKRSISCKLWIWKGYFWCILL